MTKMHVNDGERILRHSTPHTDLPPAATSANTPIGRLSSRNDISPVLADSHEFRCACALDVPSREPDSAWRWLIGSGIAVAVFATAWFLVHAVAKTVGWL